MKPILLSGLFEQPSPLDELFEETWVVGQSGKLDEPPICDFKHKVLVLWGGEDISPSIYGQKPCIYTQARNTMSLRDRLEYSLAREAMRMNIPIIGICRGAQLMCALSGGSLFQHVTSHLGAHKIITNSGNVLITNSIHHQMMDLAKVDCELLAFCPRNLSTQYIIEGNKNVKGPEKEPEIAWIPGSKSLCIQGHPEFYGARDEFITHIQNLVKEFVIPNA